MVCEGTISNCANAHMRMYICTCTWFGSVFFVSVCTCLCVRVCVCLIPLAFTEPEHYADSVQIPHGCECVVAVPDLSDPQAMRSAISVCSLLSGFVEALACFNR